MFTPFYHQLLRKYHIAFGALFKNITLLRNDVTGDEVQRLVVPIEYANREGWLTRMRQDPELDNQAAIVLPRLAYEMTGMRYDPMRKLNSLNQRTSPSRDAALNNVRRWFAGNPYMLSFNLYAITRSIEDANQITEQIISGFTPDYVLLVRLIPSLGILDRVRVVMESGSPQWSDNFETTSFQTTREIVLTFSFTVSAMFYGPVSAVPPNIIRHIMVDLYNIPNSIIMENSTFLLTDSLARFQLEDQTGRLLDESSIVDLRGFARQARIDIVPNPLNAPPTKPVDTTTTITEYVDGKQFYSSLGIDDITDIDPPIR
jgi:hypothetical protein